MPVLGLIARGAAALGKAAVEAAKKKKPQARKATQKEYDEKLKSRGKMTDQANKERMKKTMQGPSQAKGSMKDYGTGKGRNKKMASRKK